jgi:hypothetical protein
LWVISHPESVTATELGRYDVTFDTSVEAVRQDCSWDDHARTLLDAAVSVRERHHWMRPTSQG